MRPIAVIIVLLLVVASLLVAGCTTSNNDQTPSANATLSASATPSSQTEKTTFSSTRGYSITYPSTWGKLVNNSTAAVVEIALTMSPNNINVVTVANTAKGMTLQEFTDSSLQDYTRYYSDYSLLSIENTTLAGQPANKIVWKATVPQKIGNSISNAQIKTMQYLVVHNGKEYVIAYKTVNDDYDKYLTQAQEVINTFKLAS